LKLRVNSNQIGKNIMQYKKFIENLEKAKIDSGIAIVTKKKTIYLVKTGEEKHFRPSKCGSDKAAA